MASWSSWAASSRPVGSGTCGVSRLVDGHGGAVARPIVADQDLLGPVCLIAVTPAGDLVALDLVSEPQHPMHECLRAGWTSGHVNVDRHELVRWYKRVVVEHAHRGAASTHRDRPLGIQHLVVNSAYHGSHLDRDPAG